MNYNWSKLSSSRAFLIFIVFLTGITWLISRYPGHNGDMPFYIACAIEKEQGSMNGVVNKTLTVLKSELSSEEYVDHAERFSSSDPVILERYRIKPFYILLIAGLHQIGFSYLHAAAIPSLIFYFFLGVSIWLIAVKRLNTLNCFMISLGCCLIYPTLLLARISTPDAISCFVLLNAFFMIYYERNKLTWICLFLLAIVIRPDNAVSEIIFLVALWKWPHANFRNRIGFSELCIFSSLIIAMLFLVNLFSTHQFFWFRDAHFSAPPGQYFKDVALFIFVIPGSFFMSLCIIFIFSGIQHGYSWKKIENYIFYLVSLIVLVRFSMYPYYEERYFSPCFLFSLLTLSFRAAGVKKELKRSEQPALG